MRHSVLALSMFLAATMAAAPSPVRDRAFALFDSGKYAEAVTQLEAYVPTAPDDLDAQVRLGWALYRLSRVADAAQRFQTVIEKDPKQLDARVGRAYCSLQSGDVESAAKDFQRILETDPKNSDAMRGLVISSRRTKSPDVRAAARSAADALSAIEPLDNEMAVTALDLSGRIDRRLFTGTLRQPIAIHARAQHDYIEVRDRRGEWRPIFVKGFNLGAALPGRFPTEFPADEATYSRWLDIMTDLGSNAVRLYTLLPPAFYSALEKHNVAKPDTPILLLQGVWMELPPGNDFLNLQYVADVEAEITRIIDAVHGNLIVAERPGHASGIYRANVSPWTLSFIIGREWEPFAVKAFDDKYPSVTGFEGTWFRVSDAHAMEVWVARMCDFAAGHEAATYRELRPLTFANWPTLDPLPHPTEANRAEEDVFRRKLGLVTQDSYKAEVWEDDLVTLDATRVRPTAQMTAGFFASYHIYPNYPDFMNLDPSYDGGKDAEGISRYAAYLRALKRYHGDQPVLVAEFGISTSRGVGHVSPMGWNHGGLDEKMQGQLVARMMRSISAEHYAGAVIFSFMDEWFKGTWSAAPWEEPEERRALWLNVESPEELYGVVANRPARAAIRVDGRADDWTNVAPLLRRTSTDMNSPIDDVRVSSDEAYVYVLIDMTPLATPVDFSHTQIVFAVDTYDRDRGERKIVPGFEVATGAEFLVWIAGPGASRVMGLPSYGATRSNGRAPMASPRTADGRFTPLTLETNRERFGRDGKRFGAVVVERGALRFGTLDPSSPDFNSLTDISVNEEAGTIELRLPWALFNVGDPSSRSVLHDQDARHVVKTDGFRFYAAAMTADGKVISRLPAAGAVGPLYAWQEWTTPAFRTELKAGAAFIREAMRSIPSPAVQIARQQ